MNHPFYRLLALLLFGLPIASPAQVLIYSEGFETDGEGTRYTTNTYVDCTNSDFFFRTNTNPVMPPTCSQQFVSTLVDLQGSFYWASEDIRTSTPNPNSLPPGDITTQNISVAGYTSLTVSLYLATSNNNGLRWESADSLNIQARLDGGSFVTVGRFMGKGNPTVGARLGLDINLDGAITGADPASNTDTVSFRKYTFSIAGVGSNLQIRLDFDQVGGSEELAVDQIEVSGILSPCTPPSITCPSAQLFFLNPNCVGNLPDYTALANMTGACSPTASQIPTPGTMVTGPGMVPVSLVATNTAFQTDTCTFSVFPMDTNPPLALCQNITAYLDGNGGVTISASQVDNGSSDVCGSVNLSLSTFAFTCTDIGSNSVVLTVADSSGNNAQCTSQVTVLDTVAPSVSCLSDTLYLNQNGVAFLNLQDIVGPNDDNCGSPSLAALPNTFGVGDVGANPVTLTATDGSGNVDSCIAMVFVIDTFATGVDGQLVSGIQWTVGPNPTDGRLRVWIGCGTCLVGDDLRLEVWGVDGRRILSKGVVMRSGSVVEELDLRDVAAGAYYVALVHEGVALVKRVVRD